MFERFLAKARAGRTGSRSGSRSLFCSVRQGSPRAEWISAAIHSLISDSAAERVGVWLEDPRADEESGDVAVPLFRGEVWEQELGSGPPEWARLAAGTALPTGLVDRGMVFEYSIEGPQSGPILGPVIGMNRVLWMPVVQRGVLRGLILLGTARREGVLPRWQAENVAAELSVLLELEEERRLARTRQADLELSSRMRGLLDEKHSAGMILGQLAESCTRGIANGGVGAVFALIAEHRHRAERKPDSLVVVELENRAQSGDPELTHCAGGEVLRPLWKQVLESGRLLGTETNGFAFEKGITRIVGVPMRWEGSTKGVLLAGLSKGKAELDSLARLELRAQLAAEVFERECREEHERDQERGQRALLESTEDALVLMDDQARVTGFSRGARELLKTLPAESEWPRDFRFAELFRPRDWERMETWILHDGGDSGAPEEWERAEVELGPLEHVTVTRVPLQVRGLRVVRLTMGKHAQVHREPPAERELESRMLRAEKMAALGQRLTGIMHDLSNPLTAILGHSQRMLSREGAEESKPEIRQIHEQAQRATGILRQLLSLTRESKLERRTLSLNDVVERTVDLHRSVLNGISLHVRTDIGERLPQIEGDYGQLQQVLLNLLQNAQHAIELSGTGDTVGVRTSVGQGSRVRLEVWDNGPGIPCELRERIFEPFFTTKPAGIGTGLGLAIVSTIVGQHGGKVQVECPAGGGARFIVELPAVANSTTRDDSRRVVTFRVGAESGQAFKEKRATVESSRLPRRILVVEDEPTVANLIADVLRDEGMHVDVLGDGRSALDAMQRCEYDLTICDLQMPGMDGPTLYAKLAQSRNPGSERFLCVTGDVVASRTHEFLQRYNLPHVAKPFRVEELTAAVREMLSGNRHATVP